MADRAYDRLVAILRDGGLASGQFVSMPGLVDMLDLPIAATREAVKRATVGGLVEVLPKRGVLVMEASPAVTRDVLKKLPGLGKDLDDFSLETVQMFRRDAIAAGYEL